MLQEVSGGRRIAIRRERRQLDFTFGYSQWFALNWTHSLIPAGGNARRRRSLAARIDEHGALTITPVGNHFENPD